MAKLEVIADEVKHFFECLINPSQSKLKLRGKSRNKIINSALVKFRYFNNIAVMVSFV